jgi:hypothetical protein
MLCSVLSAAGLTLPGPRWVWAPQTWMSRVFLDASPMRQIRGRHVVVVQGLESPAPAGQSILEV